MDETSRSLMRDVIARFCFEDRTVVDMGSYDVNGTYRDLVPGKYIGVDIILGPNVDVIVGSEEWDDLKDVDAVISGQTIEHVADIPKFMGDIYSILKPGGYLCIIAPSEGPAHDYPIWVGNFPEERLTEVMSAGGFEILEISTNPIEPWKLVTCVARKPESRKDEDEDI
jgi:SAM-dependent methyltransferase